jgi:recombination associated protein RdgC
MFFRNATIFHCHGPTHDLAEALRGKIDSMPWRAPEPSQASSCGFTKVHGCDFLEAEGALLFAVKISEKTIPAAALREVLDERVQAIEEAQGRKVYRKERLQLKDEIVHDLLPRTLPVSKVIPAYIDTQTHLVIVDASPNRAHQVLNHVRECVGTLPVQMLGANENTSRIATVWLSRGTMPGAFLLGDSCELREPGEEGGVVKLAGVDLMSEEVEGHLNCGREVHKLALSWRGYVDFTLLETWRLSGLKFTDELLNQHPQDIEGEDAIGQADLAIMVPTMRQLLEDLGKAFGGWVTQEHMTMESAA